MNHSQLIDVVNDADEPTGTVRRSEVFARHLNFRVAHIFLLDGQERLLLQRISPHHGRSAHKWGSSVAAYVSAGESYADAARRRMGEELGVDAALQKLGSIRMVDEGSIKFIELFVGYTDAASVLDEESIEELRYWEVEDVSKTLRDNPELFTTTFPYVFELFSIARNGESGKQAESRYYA